MKKIIALLIMLFTAVLLAQSPGWTTLKETNITVGTNAYDIFTNGAGNHIIVQETNALKYYKMDVNGTTIINLNPPLESTAVTSPSISGDLTRLYVVYRKNNEQSIKTKYSLNGGVSWSTLNQAPPNSNATSIECVFSKNILHVTYLVGTVVYYAYCDVSNPTPIWITYTLSNENYIASNPRICINNAGSVDTVYFTFNHSNANQLRWRRFIVGGSLSSIQPVQTGFGLLPENLGFAVDNEFIYSFWKNSLTQIMEWTFRRIWNNQQQTDVGISNSNTYVQKIFSTSTAINNPYLAAWSTITGYENSIVRMGFDDSASLIYDVIHAQPGLTPVNIVNLSAAGNDVHVVWKDNLGTNNGNNIRYKYYDDVPIPPQNLTIIKSVNNYPLLSWINPNPDGIIYKIYRRNACIGDWGPNPIGQTANLYF